MTLGPDFALAASLTGPHDYYAYPALRWRSWLSSRAHPCWYCYLPEDAHPVDGWTAARPWGDRSAPDPQAAVYDRHADAPYLTIRDAPE